VLSTTYRNRQEDNLLLTTAKAHSKNKFIAVQYIEVFLSVHPRNEITT